MIKRLESAMQFAVFAIAAPLTNTKLAIEVTGFAFHIATGTQRIALVNIAISA